MERILVIIALTGVAVCLHKMAGTFETFFFVFIYFCVTFTMFIYTQSFDYTALYGDVFVCLFFCPHSVT